MGFKPGAPSCIEREGGNYRPQRNSSTSFRIKFEQEREEEEQQQRVLAALIFSSSCFAFSSLFLGICLFSSLLFHVLLPLGSPLYEIPFSFYEAAAAAIAATWRWDPQREREGERENSEEKGIHPLLFLQVLLLLRDSWKQGSQYTHPQHKTGEELRMETRRKEMTRRWGEPKIRRKKDATTHSDLVNKTKRTEEIDLARQQEREREACSFLPFLSSPPCRFASFLQGRKAAVAGPMLPARFLSAARHPPPNNELHTNNVPEEVPVVFFFFFLGVFVCSQIGNYP